MTDIQTVPVITAMPTRKNPLGRVEEGHYRVDDGVVWLVTREGNPRTGRDGKPIQQQLAPGETARAVAHRLTRANVPARRNNFNRPLRYFPAAKVSSSSFIARTGARGPGLMSKG